MKTKLLLLFILLFAGISITASAQVKQTRKHHAYGHHLRQGKITKGEAIHLQKKKQHIRRDIRMAKRNDGKIGPMERKHIRKEMRQYKRQRHIAVHNRRTRG
ncbi:MAG: hypothetical protein IPK31_08675 [Chitinophagaceae bacterium]|nr:hypothetical protein [Chitinophagaceae bacterium]